MSKARILRNIRRRPDGCWLWTAGLSNGYGCFWHDDGKLWYAHRAAYTAFKGTIPDGLHVLHSCDNRRCCNPDHLHLGTNAENMREAAERGLMARGERHCRAKLTDDAVRQIRHDPRSLSKIARDYGVDLKQIHRVKRRETWKHVA